MTLDSDMSLISVTPWALHRHYPIFDQDVATTTVLKTSQELHLADPFSYHYT